MSRAEPIAVSPKLPASTPWDLAKLSAAPTFQWVNQHDSVWSLLYRGEPYQDKPSTGVFAYYATPGTLAGKKSLDKNLPAIVLVHGGGGKAYRQWVEMWAKQGYAALAMDLYGNKEDYQKLPDGGPLLDGRAWEMIDEPLPNQWFYHAVANVILAHSLLRDFPEVDADRTAITGISWGGYLTCIVAGLDNRFKAAVPVYGCGFLHENSAWTEIIAKLAPPQKERFIRLFDPSQYVGLSKTPMFFINGTNDGAYPLDSYAKTYNLVKGPRNIRITVNMEHCHPSGWEPNEIVLFVDQYLREGIPLPKITSAKVIDNAIEAQVTAATTLLSASLNFTTEHGPINQRHWQRVPAVIKGDTIIVDYPADVRAWFLTVCDERYAIVSSEVRVN